MAIIKKTDESEKIKGTSGDDVIYAMGGDDLIRPLSGDDTVYGGLGDDTVVITKGNDVVDGGKGFDMLDVWAVDGVDLDLATGAVTFANGGTWTVAFSHIEGVWGSWTDDRILGTEGDNDLFALEGNDTVDGRGGDDVINGYTGNDGMLGGAGDDRLMVAAGTDTFDGGDDTDTLDFKFDETGVAVALGDGAASFDNRTGSGTTTFANVENLFGSNHADSLEGDGGINVLLGRKGDDSLSGLDGADVLDGGAGSDELTGGDHADIFRYLADSPKDRDTITDFAVDIDAFMFSKKAFGLKQAPTEAMMDGPGYATLKAAQFDVNDTGKAEDSRVRLVYESDTGTLWYDADGNGSENRHAIADLDAGLALTADDFYVV